ncbi:MAG: PHP domain-containing protein [Christensenellaceae bacterium]|jgi:putative hydrolase|nr:PHP domain-containing protein [Christensenellaceae bacterium]
MKTFGDYHTHTVLSHDGKCSIEDNVSAAAAAGLSEIAITEHGYGKNRKEVMPKDFAKVRERVHNAGKKSGISALFGIEANIIGDKGEIDIKDNERRDLDILLVGVHQNVKPKNLRTFFNFFLPNDICATLKLPFPKWLVRRNTRIVCDMLEKVNPDILTHPNRYYKVDILDVARVCAKRGILLELNEKRVSFRPIDFERMLAVGAKFIIGSDAHTMNNVGKTTNVAEFLSKCTYNKEDIINLNGVFARPKPQIIKDIKE